MTVRFLALSMAFAAISACVHTPNPIEAAKAPDPVLASGQPASATAFSDFKAEIEDQLPRVEAIARLGARDQLVRQMINQWKKRPDMSAEQRDAFISASAQYMLETDQANTGELKRLMTDISWRDLSNAGGDVFIKAFFVVQHSPDHAFQAEVLNELEPLVAEGLIDAQQYTYLFDRVQLRNGEQQLYGTQMECVDGQYDVTNLQSPDTVDERRIAVGLQPLEAYIQFVRDYSGAC